MKHMYYTLAIVKNCTSDHYGTAVIDTLVEQIKHNLGMIVQYQYLDIVKRLNICSKTLTRDYHISFNLSRLRNFLIIILHHCFKFYVQQLEIVFYSLSCMLLRLLCIVWQEPMSSQILVLEVQLIPSCHKQKNVCREEIEHQTNRP